MKIASLLEIDKKFGSKDSLAESFGDSFLVQNNRIFQSIRKQMLSRGFKLSSAVNPDYQVLPLSQLDKILQSKELPYSDNVGVLVKIEKQIPGTTVWDEVVDNLKRNYLFHESCHAVASHESKNILSSKLDKPSEVVRLFIEESFANSCELLGIIYAEDAAHRIFYEASSYIFMLDSRPHLKKIVSELGLSFVLKFFILCYLHSNFLYDFLDDRQFNSVIAFAKTNQAKSVNLNPAQLKNLKQLSRNAFELNPRFRETTSGFYLRLMGLACSKQELKQIDFIRLIDKDPRLASLVHRLAQIFES